MDLFGNTPEIEEGARILMLINRIILLIKNNPQSPLTLAFKKVLAHIAEGPDDIKRLVAEVEKLIEEQDKAPKGAELNPDGTFRQKNLFGF